MVVALVEVELPVIFKFPVMVEEALEMKPVVDKRPVASTLNNSEAVLDKNLRKFPAKELVEEALIRSPVVPVAVTWKRACLGEVVAPIITA